MAVYTSSGEVKNKYMNKQSDLDTTSSMTTKHKAIKNFRNKIQVKSEKVPLVGMYCTDITPCSSQAEIRMHKLSLVQSRQWDWDI